MQPCPNAQMISDTMTIQEALNILVANHGVYNCRERKLKGLQDAVRRRNEE